MQFGLSPQRNDWSYSTNAPGRQHRPVIAAIHDLVDVAEDDVRRVHAELRQQLDLLDAAGAGLAMGEDRNAGPRVCGGGRLEDRPVALGRAVQAAGDLDHAGPVWRAADDRARIVELVDPVDDVEHEQVGEIVDADQVAPMRRTVEALVVEAGRGDDVDAGPPRELGELPGIASRIAGHRVHGGAQPEPGGLGHLDRHQVDVAEVEVGLQLDRTPAVDDEVLVGIGDAQVARVDVAEDRPDERHVPGSGRTSGDTDSTDQPPSTVSSWPVTTRDSSDRK